VAWTWAAATCRGTSHVRDGSDCQDASRCISVGPDSNVLIAVVCDGAGSASYGGQGAAITCRTVSESARIHFSNSKDLPRDDDVWNWVDEARERINRAAASRSLERREFSCTLVTVFATDAAAMILHIGDGAAVVRLDGKWVAPSWPAHGEYASQTFFVTDDPAPQLRITRLEIPVDVAAVFSDGIERLVLDFASQTAPAPFFDIMMKPFESAIATGRNQKLSASLKRYLDSDRVNERTDDDKSLVFAVRR
jgi:hypothetical protein